jgi:3-oxoacyl-[acyl-carrier protein] reductase
MIFDLTGKTTLVTGATGGIGEAIAEALHQRGATVAISGTRLAALEALAARLGNRVHVLPCNLFETSQARNLVPQAEKAMGRLDVLVANAGIIRTSQPIAQQRDEDWAAVLQVNLTATLQLVQAAICGMTERGFGRLIAVTSVLGTTGLAGQAHYAAAKAGAVAMVKSVARECAEHGVTANCIAPGFLAPPMAGMHYSASQNDAILASIPANRLGSALDVAAAAAFLASDEAGYITGQTLHINGGLAMI